MTAWTSLRSRFILRLGGCLLLWWALTGGAPSSRLIGGLTIAVALWVMRSTPQGPRWRLSLSGLLRFLPYFFLQSVRGGIDVTRRAFSPSLPLDPTVVAFSLNLPPGSARIFFLNSVSLLPGTLSADLDHTTLSVHLLDRQVDPQLDQLERRVAALFGVTLGGQP